MFLLLARHNRERFQRIDGPVLETYEQLLAASLAIAPTPGTEIAAIYADSHMELEFLWRHLQGGGFVPVVVFAEEGMRTWMEFGALRAEYPAPPDEYVPLAASQYARCTHLLRRVQEGSLGGENDGRGEDGGSRGNAVGRSPDLVADRLGACPWMGRPTRPLLPPTGD